MKRFYLFTVIIVLTTIGCARIQAYQKTETGIKCTIDSINVEVQFFNPNIIRVLKTPADRTVDKKSLSVIKTPDKTVFDVKQNDNILTLKSENIMVDLDLKTGKIKYSTCDGIPLLTEKENSSSFTPFIDVKDKTYSVKQTFILEKDEAIYGLGQLQRGKMIQRNQTVRMVQGNTEDYIPFFQSIKGYGLFWDNYSPTTFTNSNDKTSFDSKVGDCIDYYFMFGGNADGVIAQMRELTGQVPMFPLWTFGYWQSKERYKSQHETVGVVKKYRELGVPLDGIIQDWQYWGDNYHWNAMEFLNPEFPNPQQMVDNVHNMNAHIIISIWSSFGPKTEQYKELEKNNMLLDFLTWPLSGVDAWPPDMNHPSGVRVYDPYNPKARDIYWKYLEKGLFSLDIDGWWMDSTEPDHMEFKPSDFDNMTHLGSFRKVRNAYPLMCVGGVYTHQRNVTSSKRVFILTRSAFAGQQRYGANTWSGDVVSSWNALRNQISAGLNFSLCAIPYWNSDIGGFFLWRYPQKLNDADYRELYVRWIQFGAFCPMMRSHGADAPREIYQFGKKGSKVYDAIEKSINLRYSLLPYIYSTAWDVTANHSSMMRALMMDFAHDKDAININDQYMFGKSLLVCPVTKPMYNKLSKSGRATTHIEDFSMVKSDEVYLPNGTDWFDYWTGEKLKGGQRVNKETPIDIIPLYVKAGSILPIGPKVQYAAEKKWDELEIRIYPGANGEFMLYEDEKDNYNYEKGAYSTIKFKWDDKARQLSISERKGSFKGMLESRMFNVVLIDKSSADEKSGLATKSIKYNGRTTIVNF
jgi:alpha-D-xyloside xylohydrolase